MCPPATHHAGSLGFECRSAYHELWYPVNSLTNVPPKLSLMSIRALNPSPAAFTARLVKSYTTDDWLPEQDSNLRPTD